GSTPTPIYDCDVGSTATATSSHSSGATGGSPRTATSPTSNRNNTRISSSPATPPSRTTRSESSSSSANGSEARLRRQHADGPRGLVFGAGGQQAVVTRAAAGRRHQQPQ